MSIAVVGCPDCGARQRLQPPAPNTLVQCVTCSSLLERTHGRTLSGALACSAATLLLLLPANLMPFLKTEALGVSRTSVLGGAAEEMLKDGIPWLAVVVALFVVVFPLVRFVLLTVVLGSLRLDRRPAWLGPAFRWANALETWAMADVFLLALAVAYARLKASIAVHLEIGAMAFVAAALLSLFTRAVLDKAAVWALIAPDRDPSDDRHSIECVSCGLLSPPDSAGLRCSRCHAALRFRKPQSVSRTLALTAAAVLLYIPANLLPLATLPINFRPTSYTVLQGVLDLAGANLWGLALVVFIASFAIPALKLAGLSWCAVSIMRRSGRRLVAKTRTYRVVEEIGRWSMVDPFVIGCFAPVMHYNAFIYGRAGPAALPFTAVVILTIISAKIFDPRLMWDAAGKSR